MRRSPVRTAVAAALTVLAPLAALSAVVAPAGAAPTAARATGPRTLVIGDSITHSGEPYLLALRPRWVVDGVKGRTVDKLPRRITADVATYGTPRNLVLALGQNPSEGWTRADYRDAAEMVPRTVQVFFVTTYRDPAIFGQEAADQQDTYSRWMRRVARNHDNVHTLPWRTLVKDGTAVLYDGSHPDEPSRQVWAEMIRDGIAEVAAATSP